MNLTCLDVEGVLIPEIWKGVAAKTGIDALNRTTRDEPDYDVLMRYRIDIMDEHNIRIDTIQEVIGEMEPLPGAKEFIDWLTSETRTILLSDTFAEFAKPLMAKLGYPTLFCHNLVIEDNGRIAGYTLRMEDHKRKAVEAFKALSFNVTASGDSYNDLTMLRAADNAILMGPTDAFAAENSDLPVARNHDELKALISKTFK